MKSLLTCLLLTLMMCSSAAGKNVPLPELYDSYWRDDATGDLILGIFPEGVVYDGQFWDYAKMDDKSGKFLIQNEEGSLSVKISSDKDGKMSLKMGADKPRVLNRVDGSTLPPYPEKEYRANFEDTGYEQEDSVTISGWIRGLTDDVIQQRGNNIIVYNSSLLPRKTISAEMDSLGRFSVTFPVLNSTSVYINTKVAPVYMPVEPGKNYCLIVDTDGRKTFVMGDDARVQNEILANNFSVEFPAKDKDSENYIEKIEEWRYALNDSIDSLRTVVPTLSDLAISYLYNNALSDGAGCLGQSRFTNPSYMLSKAESDYTREKIWKELPQPILLYGAYRTFLRDFIDSELNRSDYTLLPKYGEGFIILNIPREMVNELKPETDLIKEWSDAGKLDFAETVPDSIQSVYLSINKKISEFMQKKGLSGKDEYYYIRMRGYLDILEDLNATPEVTDLFMLEYFLQQMEQEVAPLCESLRNSVDTVITSPGIRDLILSENAKYERMLARAKASDIKISDGSDVSDISEGKALFEKFVGPHKGKFVLIDVWGTWCVPCKMAMEDFKHEYETLSPYGVDFLFFANHSNEETLKTVVAEYDVSGEGVTHYNLPEAQQHALEDFLNVSSYPSYRLVDPDGNLVDRHVDARHLQELEEIIKELSTR